jgi:hypothetical protein
MVVVSLLIDEEKREEFVVTPKDLLMITIWKGQSFNKSWIKGGGRVCILNNILGLLKILLKKML